MLGVTICYASRAHAESFGVNFLGTIPGSTVTNSAGVIPQTNWNNITVGSYGSGTILSGDGLVSATLTIKGNTNAIWRTGVANDGGNGSLMNGYLDLGANRGGPETNIVSGLTGSVYTVYIYNQADARRPQNGGDWLPNYNVNGVAFCTAMVGGNTFTGFVQGGITLENTNTYPPLVAYGNYIQIDNVVPNAAKITIIGENDSRTWRTAFNGFQIVLNTSVTPPGISAQSASSTNIAGSTVQVGVFATGSPLNYQWKAGAFGSAIYTNLINGGQFSGVTGPTLTISNFTPANVGDYIVVITNVSGSVTSAVPTTLGVAPMSITGPTPAGSKVYPGASAFFSVVVAGSEPLTYRWRKNGVVMSNGGHISGANTNKLVISSADAGDVSSYDVVVTNVFDSVTSSPAMFGLVAVPISGSYAESVKTNGAVAYWRLSEVDVDPASGSALAYDFIGGRAGLYGASTLNGFNNISGPASPAWPGFESLNTAVQVFTGYTNSFVQIPVVEALNLNTNTVTIAAWVNPSTIVNNAGIVFQRQNGVVGLVIGNQGHLGFNWNDNGASYGWDSLLALPLNQWSYVALVVSPTQTRIYLYNSTTWTNASLDFAAGNAGFGGPLYIGVDSFDPATRAFDGVIDEVAIYKRSLSSAEIAQQISLAAGVTVIPPADPTISIQKSGANVQKTWTGTLLESANVNGPWTTNSAGPSPLIVVPAGPQMFYRSK